MTAKPSGRSVADEYDAFADAYDAYFLDRLGPLLGDQPLPAADLLAELRTGAAVLDCACGPGHLVLGLAKRGYTAYGTDISPGMIQVARRHAREVGLKARFAVASWEQLPSVISRRFGLAFCVGNAIGHCRGEREMVAALRGMGAVLKPGGTLYVDTRCWETYRKQRERFRAFPTKGVRGRRVTWLHARHYPRRFSDPHLIEVVVITIEPDGDTSVRAFPITYHPFRERELKQRLRAAGFAGTRSTHQPGAEWYAVTARWGS